MIINSDFFVRSEIMKSNFFDSCWRFQLLCFFLTLESSLPTDEDEDGEEKLRMFENFCSSKFRNEKHSSNTLEENIKQLTNQ